MVSNLIHKAAGKQSFRAKRKIVDANIPYRMPAERDLPERLDEVLAVLYLMFNEGYLATAGEQATRRDVAEDAAWLAGLMVRLMPDEPEALGLLALMRLHLARAGARFDAAGNLVLLQDQDRGRWEQERITSAIVLLQRAAALRRTGPYQLQAAIAACHAEARTWGETDWQQIVTLYDALLDPTWSDVFVGARHGIGGILRLAVICDEGFSFETLQTLLRGRGK